MTWLDHDADDWLQRHRLSHLIDAFRAQRIRLDCFHALDEADCVALGMTIGDRKAFAAALRRDGITGLTVGGSADVPDVRQVERRLLTLVFVDLVGSTALSLRIDPEEMRRVLQSYYDLLENVTRAFGGHVACRLGDGVMCAFGWPTASEDQAERAVMMALEAVRRVLDLAPAPDIKLEARIGIASGSVVVGDLTGNANDITGSPPNLAARLQAEAAPGQVLVDGATAALLPRGLPLSDLGTRLPKGYDTPVRVFRATAANTLDRTRRQSDGAHRPILGRDAELAALTERWWATACGSGSVTLVEGEPGIGKTRLIKELCRQLALGPNQTLTLQCIDYRSGSALFPLLEGLKRVAGFLKRDDLAARRRKLEKFVAPRCTAPRLAFALFASALGIADDADEAHAAQYAPDRTRATVDAFVELTVQAAAGQPLFIVVEDVHWADPSTIRYCAALARAIAGTPLMVIMTTRPHGSAARHGLTGIDVLRLTRLQRAESQRILARHLPAGFSTTMLAAILSRADDIPLYLEELARSAASGLPADELPASVQSSFIARIDRLGIDRPFLQFLSILGQSFSLSFILECTERAEQDVRAALERLVAAEFLDIEDSPDQLRYQFRHALMQEAAYASVLRRSRERLHNQVADKLVARRLTRGVDDPEVIARHLSLAGRPAEAVPFWQDAGDALAQRSAHTEAAQQYERGLADVGALPDGLRRAELEFSLRVRLSAALLTIDGWSAPSVETNYDRALTLSDRLGDPGKHFIALRGRFNVLFLRGRLTAARALIPALMAAAHRSGDRLSLAMAYIIDGGCAVHEADFEPAAARLRECLALLEPSTARRGAVVLGTDPVVIALAHLAWAEWFLGARERACGHMAEALTLARKGQHAFSQTYAEGFASCFCQFAGNATETKRHADVAVALSAKHGFHYFEGWGRILRGWALTFLDDVECGLPELDRGIRTYRATGAEQILPYAFALRREARKRVSRGGRLAFVDDYRNEQDVTSSESRFYAPALIDPAGWEQAATDLTHLEALNT